MKLRTTFIALGMILTFVNFAQGGGAVAKVKARKTSHVRMHVQVPKPRVHLTQQPIIEGRPMIHLNSHAEPQVILPAKKPEVVYQSQILSTTKPMLRAQPLVEEQFSEVKDIVDLEQLNESLQSSSQAWALIINDEDKQIVIQEFINKFQGQGVNIKKSAAYYKNFIDKMSRENPGMLTLPFDRVLHVVTVMEYDFDNGQDMELLAQKILGLQAYQKNKKRLLLGRAGIGNQ